MTSDRPQIRTWSDQRDLESELDAKAADIARHEWIKSVVAAYGSSTAASIALGSSPKYLAVIARKHGVPFTPYRGGRAQKITVEALRECAAKGMTRREAAAALGATPNGVTTACIRNGIALRYEESAESARLRRRAVERARAERAAEASKPKPEPTPLERMKALAARENAALRRVLGGHA